MNFIYIGIQARIIFSRLDLLLMIDSIMSLWMIDYCLILHILSIGQLWKRDNAWEQIESDSQMPPYG